MSTEQFPAPELTCKELVELVTAYLENALTPEEHARIVAHLGECDGCERYVEQMRETINALGTLQENNVSAHAEQKLREVFRKWKTRSQEPGSEAGD